MRRSTLTLLALAALALTAPTQQQPYGDHVGQYNFQVEIDGVGEAGVLQLSLQPGPGETQIGSQRCPTHLRMRGKIAWRGGAGIAGQAFFVGRGYASPHQRYRVGGDQSVSIETLRPLEWKPAPTAQMKKPPITPVIWGSKFPKMMTQTLEVGFKVLDENRKEIASTPQQAIQVSCVAGPAAGPSAPLLPKALPMVQRPGGKSAAPGIRQEQLNNKYPENMKHQGAAARGATSVSGAAPGMKAPAPPDCAKENHPACRRKDPVTWYKGMQQSGTDD